MSKPSKSDQVIKAVRTTIQFLRGGARTITRWLIHPGRHDLYLSMIFTFLLLAPLFAEPAAAQVGIGDAEDILCNTAATGFNLAQLITIGFGIISGYFILKFLFRTMTGLDKAGSPQTSTQQAGKQSAKGGVYSLIAALLPLIIPVFLSTAGIDAVSCLMPGETGTAVIVLL